MAVSSESITGLAELARQVREHTLEFMQVPPAWLTWAPEGTSNHILWHAGHVLWVQDALTIEPLTGRSELPSGWAAMFGQNSSPAATSQWPEAAVVGRHLEEQLNRILGLLAERVPEILDRGNETPRGGWALLPGIIHGWHDEARHQGEMYLLLKLRRAQL